jgi:hypothetical protein
VTAGWVAGSVRARVLANRRIGLDQSQRVAACGSLDDALVILDGTAYRIAPDRVPRGSGDPQQALAAAQRLIAEAVLWDLRVLAGWLPQGGTTLMRALAGWFEIANVSERLRELEDGTAGQYFELGALATAWAQLRRSRSLADLRNTLARSAWKDPGGESPAALEVGLRARWAQRVSGLGEPARTWAAAAVALLVAGERLSPSRPDNPVLSAVATELLGRRSSATSTVGELAGALPSPLSWVFDAGTSGADLWRNEVAWWSRVERDGLGLLGRSGFDHKRVIGAAVVLAADARRVWSALEIAARGGGSVEVFDVVA